MPFWPHETGALVGTSETFIVREIDALASAGDGAGAGAGAGDGGPIGTIRSLFASPDTTVHPVAARWSGRAWRPGARDVAAGLGWALLHRPGPLARLLGAVAVDFRRSPAMLLRALATLLVATAHARDLSRTSGVHVHAHYATFPLLGGLAFTAIAEQAGVESSEPVFYVMVFVLFQVVLALNFVMTAGYGCYLERVPFREKLKVLPPVLPSEFASAMQGMGDNFIPAALESLEQDTDVDWRPRVPQWPAVGETMATAIQSALTGQKKPKDALDEAQNRIQQIVKG